MKIDYEWGKPPKKLPKESWFRRVFGHHPVPLHMSSHYNRDHFVDDGQPRLF